MSKQVHISRKQTLLYILWGFFITNAVLAEMIGVKLTDVGEAFYPGVFVMPVGILPWPIVFLTTDLLNEFYGKAMVKRLSIITACLIAYAFIVIFASIHMSNYSVNDEAGDVIVGVNQKWFASIFGQGLWIIIGSITAFLVAQMVDVFVFWFFREKTGGKMIWLRATGSTAVSQLIDTFVVQGIAFWLTGIWTTAFFIKTALISYSVKLILAIALTPLIYLGHALVKKYLGESLAEQSIRKSAEESLSHTTDE
jgi:queuosine precursor transporter